MASKKLSSDTSLKNSYKLSRGVASVARPSAPTIGTATDTGSGAMSVTFTASTLGPAASSYTLASSSGVTASGSSSPLTLQETVVGTYTYSVYGTNANGNGPSSVASNSVAVTSVVTMAYESIATIAPSGGSTTVLFTSIPQTYTHLQMRMYVRQTTQSAVRIQLNGLGGTSNGALYWWGLSNSTTGYYNGINTNFNYAYYQVGTYYGSVAPNTYSPGIYDLYHYSSTVKNKSSRILCGTEHAGGATGGVELEKGIVTTTSPITTLEIVANGTSFAAGTYFALYGIK
jgi:hypothetical protein